ncbi:cupin domain-containing protein [Tomitella gaofuii]|uniref:cupin domain-containing protein n=1 Tax=Tomitella gaofuii TaxID=2760083 RepID=UPI0015F8F8CB|nr:cupin domain-containing protein [Tomitella gaofuii]
MSRAQHPTPACAAVCAAASVAAAALAVVAAPAASATPPSGVIPIPLGTVSIAGTDVTARVIVFSPGGTTGWHTHDGDVPGIVTGGYIIRTLDDCSVYTAGPGDPMSGGGAAHVGTNTGETTAFLWSLYIDQAGDPPAIDAPAADCPEP